LCEKNGIRRQAAAGGFGANAHVSSSSEGQARVPVLHKDAETTVVRPPDPPPAYRYLGSFGPQTNPLLVFTGNAAEDIVNVQILKKP
jgi:hypothetical protein